MRRCRGCAAAELWAARRSMSYSCSGVERDNDLWYRGQMGTRDGRKGNSPLGDKYFLSNSDFYKRLYRNGLFGIKAGPLFDIGRCASPTSGLAAPKWLFAAGLRQS